MRLLTLPWEQAALALRAISAERGAHGGDEVPKGHEDGLAWNRTWHDIQRMNQF